MSSFSSQQMAESEELQAPAGISTLERPFCTLCFKQGDLLYAGLVDWLFGAPGKWGIRTCSGCGTAWLDPQPAAEDLPALYSRYLTHNIQTSTTWLGRLQRATSQCALSRAGYPVEGPKEILPRLLAQLTGSKRRARLSVLGLGPTNKGTLLDVGCGNGDFILRMRSLGWRVSGVDPDSTAAAYGRRQGLQVFTGTIADVSEAARYDVITLNHVIEHVADPVNLLRECHKRLHPDGGRLIMTTPNINSCGHRWFRKYWRGLEVPRHFTIFSPSSLRDCIERAKFRVISLSTETRLAPMIYRQSSCAREGGMQIGDQSAFATSIKLASHLFRIMESCFTHFGKEFGEEIFCTAAREP
jgi:2-polyprenyl-3-methyl-5-hydroxy-6-metoxy-1,4-benzoquinol methylase